MMKKSAVSLSLAAAALIAASASPVLAAGKIRSGASLPSKSFSASRSSSRFTAPARIATPTRFTAPSSYNAPAAARLPSFGNNGGRFGGGLSTLFGFLPPRLQQVIASALGNAGPGAERLCRLLGIPECEISDSNG